MSTERTLERIDDALEDWDQWDGHSPDAARWDGDDWVDERRPEGWYVGDLEASDPPLCHGQEAAGHRDISLSGEQRLYMVDPENPDAPTMTELENATELTNVMRLHWGEPSEFTFGQRVIVGMDPASQHAHITVVPETTPLSEAWRRIAEAAIEFAVEFHAIKRQAEADTGKSWAYLVQRAQRPHSAAERTRSPRWRAGTRRTKRHARRRHG